MNGVLFSYTLSSSIVLAMLYLGYKWSLSGKSASCFNRSVIICIYLVSLLFFPLIGQLKHIGGSRIATQFEIDVEMPAGGEIAGMDMPVARLVMSGIMMIWIVGMAVVAAGWAMAYVRLYRLLRRSAKSDYDGWTLVVTDDDTLAPFSWRQYIFISNTEANGDERELEALLTHEMHHLVSRHWLDLTLAQFVCVIQWFNPASWLLRDELRAVHEYDADKAVIDKGFDIRSYQMLLIKRAVGKRFPSVANSFNHSKLKNRITMMCKRRPSSRSRMRGLALLPSLGAALLVADIPAVASVIEDASCAGIVFAGHREQSEGKVSENKPEVKTDNCKEFYAVVEEMAEFPGGNQELMKYLANNLRYPQEAHAAGMQGCVIVKFVVGADGSIKDATVIKGVKGAPSLDNEAIRVVMSMPAWKPGKVGGKPVSSYFNLPVRFSLTGPEENAASGEEDDDDMRVKVVGNKK